MEKNINSNDDYKIYLHTVGNLTITGYNSEMSNKSFSHKQDILKKSKFIYLNEDVIDKNIWDIETIKQRTERLTNILLSIYEIIKIEDDDIVFEKDNVFLTLDDDPTGLKPLKFSFENVDYKVKYFSDVLIEVCKLLYVKNSQFFLDLSKDKKNKIFSNNKNDLRNSRQITKDIYIETNYSAQKIFDTIKYLMNLLNVNQSNFFIEVKHEEQNEDLD